MPATNGESPTHYQDDPTMPAGLLRGSEPMSRDNLMRIHEFIGDPSIPTDLPGFRVYLDDGLKPSSRVEILLGYPYAHDAERNELVDTQVFDLNWISVHPSMVGRGIGTELLRRALEIARSREFHVGRALIGNNKLIKMLQKLQSEGLVREIKLFEPFTDGIAQLPTADMLEREPWSPKRAAEHLNSADTDEDGFSDNKVECVFWLRS